MPEFVVHQHIADRAGFHHDLRLESGGILESWAVPKGVPTEPGKRVLAIKVEDHPLSYKDFVGEIEDGYGKGLVSILDSGEYELISESPTSIHFQLRGDILRGNYYLRKWEGKKWLLWKQSN